MGGWVDGWESRVKDCLQQSKMTPKPENPKTHAKKPLCVTCLINFLIGVQNGCWMLGEERLIG